MNTDTHDEAIRHIQKQNYIKEIVKYIYSFIAAVAVFFLLVSACDPDVPAFAEADMPTPLPMIDGDWHRQGRVWVMELAHGWIVRDSYSHGISGLCFVPKPGNNLTERR
jgi:hypothetical protein